MATFFTHTGGGHIEVVVVIWSRGGVKAAAAAGAARPSEAAEVPSRSLADLGDVDAVGLTSRGCVCRQPVSGAPEEMRKVAAWVERLARDTGRAISATVETFDDPEDQDWAVCRIRGL